MRNGFGDCDDGELKIIMIISDSHKSSEGGMIIWQGQ